MTQNSGGVRVYATALSPPFTGSAGPAGVPDFYGTIHPGVLIKLSVKGLPAGEHAFHVHGVGKCEPPFTSAGGHFNPGGKKHGIMAAEGHHAGDMPNLYIPTNGEIVIEVVNAAITLEKGKSNSVFGPDGTALIIHAGKHDYKTDPTGDAGGRIACGIIQ